MALLMATCPRCGAEVNTGIAADKQTVDQLGPSLQVLVLCDACSQYQKMLVQDLRFATEEAA